MLRITVFKTKTKTNKSKRIDCREKYAEFHGEKKEGKKKEEKNHEEENLLEKCSEEAFCKQI